MCVHQKNLQNMWTETDRTERKNIGGGKKGGRGKRAQITQTLYAHMNKIKIKKKERKNI
jgi:hypothetical protein